MASVPAEVAHSSRVGASLILLHLVDDLHRPDFRCATHGPCRESGAEDVVGTVLRSKLAADIGNNVHHVAVALHDHHIVHAHTAILGNSTHIIASEIDEHDMLGAFLFIRKKLGSKRVIFLRGLPPPARSGDRADINLPTNRAHVHLRRTPHEGKLRRFVNEHIGRGIDVAQCAVEIDRLP